MSAYASDMLRPLLMKKHHYCHFAPDIAYLFHGNHGLHSIHLCGKPSEKPQNTQ